MAEGSEGIRPLLSHQAFTGNMIIFPLILLILLFRRRRLLLEQSVGAWLRG